MVVKLLLPFSLFCALFSAAYCQEDTVYTKEVVVSASKTPSVYSENSRIVSVIHKEEISKAPVQNLQDLLEFALDADVRQRGSKGVQSDISIRGGNFEQTLILINGVMVNDAQTGHHNLNLPIDLDDIERIEILEGPGSRVFGPNAFSGAINIITSEGRGRNAKLSLNGGDYGYYKTSLSGSFSNETYNNYLSINKSGSRGYVEDTDFNLLNLFYQGGYKSGFGKFDVQAGYTDKSFGASTFYTPMFPDQYEEVKTTFASIGYSTGETLKFETQLFWRRNQDRFELFRNNPASWYSGHNYHLTNIYGGKADLSYYNALGVTTIGLDFKADNILSNVLGDPMSKPEPVPGEPAGEFTRSKSRSDVSLFAEHSLFLGKFSASAGLLAFYNTEYGMNFYPGIDLSYNIIDNLRIYGSFNRTLRLPTYTDLYYKDPASVGNPELKPEEAISYEAGFKYVTGAVKSHISVFRRESSNLIDWVKMPGDSLWRSMNLTEINFNGLEAAVQLAGSALLGENSVIDNISLGYSYIDASHPKADFLSEYALDYLKHKVSLGIQHRIYKGLGASWQVSYQDRAGSYVDYNTKQVTDFKPFWLADGRIFYKWKHMNAYIEMSNIFNTNYQDISNVREPGRWIIAGVTADLDFGQEK